MTQHTGAATAPFAVERRLIFTKRQARSDTKRHKATRSDTKRHGATARTNVHEMFFSQSPPLADNMHRAPTA